MAPKISKTPKSAPMQPAKDTLYIDVDDEITTVIDKLESSKSKIIAIVLPKRAATFQSIVNLKLLKKASTAEKKNIVLITSDESIMRVAAVANIHVAPTPTSKPVIPVAKHAAQLPDESEEFDDVEDESASKKKGLVVAAAAGLAAATALYKNDPIELDNTVDLDTADSAATIKDTKKPKKGLKIPDFSSFRLRLGLGIAAVVALIVMWVFGFVILPKATITVNTNFRTLPVNTTITTDLNADEVDLETNTVPAKRSQVEKINKLVVDATGEKNIGDKASGTLTLTNCIDDGEPKIIPAGTQFSSGNLTFVSTKQVELPPAITSGGQCVSGSFGQSRDVGAQAAEPGPQYNISARAYNSAISGIEAFGSDMTGGTTRNVTVVSQSDVDGAIQELTGASKSEALAELRAQLETQSVKPLDETFGESEPNTVVSPKVGSEADSVEVTITINYNLTGVSNESIAQILDTEIRDAIEDSSQNIRDNGLESVVFGLSEDKNQAQKLLTLQTVATIGPELPVDQLKQDLAGKSRGEIEKQLEAIDGVRSVSVEYSPVWITTTPKNADKIEIIFNESDE